MSPRPAPATDDRRCPSGVSTERCAAARASLRLPSLLLAFNAALVAMIAAASGCASVSRTDQSDEVLVLDNATPDVVRVYLKIEQHEILLGRVDPLSRKEFKLRPAMTPGVHSSARLIVIPVGAPSLTRSTDSPLAVYSEIYPMGSFSTISWRYSGSLILPFGPYR